MSLVSLRHTAAASGRSSAIHEIESHTATLAIQADTAPHALVPTVVGTTADEVAVKEELAGAEVVGAAEEVDGPALVVGGADFAVETAADFVVVAVTVAEP